jgi:hypothetical protein
MQKSFFSVVVLLQCVQMKKGFPGYLNDMGEIDVPEPVLVELLNGELEPPVRAHEGERYRDLGVHGTQRPVLKIITLYR